MVLTLLLQVAAASAPGFGFALECGRCGSVDHGAQWRFAELPLVVSVADGGAASRGGMHAGDTLIAVDGLSLLTEAGSRRFAGARAGNRVTFLVGREGKRVEVAIVPAPMAASTTGRCLGTTGPRSSTSSSLEFSITNKNENARWIIEWNRRECSVLLHAEGAFRLLPDLADVESLGNGSTFKVNVREDKQRRELEVKSDRGALVHEWKVDGKAMPWTDESRRWLGGLLTDLDRRTAFAIDVRFPELLRRGGTSAVLSEIAQLTDEMARIKYFVRLADSATLTAPEIRMALSQLETNPVNSFARRQVLTALQKQPAIKDSSVAVALVVESMTARANLFETGHALEGLIRKRMIRSADLEMAIKATNRIDIEMSRGHVLSLFASHYKLEGAAREAYVDAAKSIRTEIIRNRLLAAIVGKEQ